MRQFQPGGEMKCAAFRGVKPADASPLGGDEAVQGFLRIALLRLRAGRGDTRAVPVICVGRRSRDRLRLWRRNRRMNGGPQLQALKIRPNATLKVAAIRSGGLSWRPLSFSTPCLFMALLGSPATSAPATAVGGQADLNRVLFKSPIFNEYAPYDDADRCLLAPTSPSAFFDPQSVQPPPIRARL